MMKSTAKRACVLAVVMALVLSFMTFAGCEQPQTTPSTSALYESAMVDAVFADADEILPLVTLTEDSDMVTFDERGEKVLMLSWHRYPESYVAGEVFTCTYGEIWVFTDKEILNWYNTEGKGVEDYTLRLEQLIGLPEEKAYTHISAFWVDTSELIRPAYQPDVTKQVTAADLDGSAIGDYADWFDGNIIWSYFDSAYPWTRLGYTYDWADGTDEYGLTEFIILPNSEVEVEWTVTTAEFWEMLSRGTLVKE